MTEGLVSGPKCGRTNRGPGWGRNKKELLTIMQYYLSLFSPFLNYHIMEFCKNYTVVRVSNI